MIRKEVEQLVLSTLRQSAELPADKDLSLDRPLAETGLDSLALVAFLTALEKQFGLAFDDAVWVERGQFTTSYFVDRICAANGQAGTPTTNTSVGAAASEPGPTQNVDDDARTQFTTSERGVEAASSSSIETARQVERRGAARLVHGIGRRVKSVSSVVFRRHAHYFLARDLEHALPKPQSDVSLEFRELSAAEFAPINPPWGCLKRNLDRWVRRGYACLTGWHDGRLATFDWLAPQGDTESLTGLDIRTRPGSCFALGLFENPEFAGKGVGLAMAAYSLHATRTRGFARQTTLVDASNVPMLVAAVQMLGFRRVGEVHTIAWFNQPRSTWTIEGRRGHQRVVAF